MKLTNEEVQRIVVRAEDEYERLKDSVHDLYDENKELKQEKERLNKGLKSLQKQNREKQKIIYKAIEYIENCHGMYRNAIGDIQPMINIKPVLDILKGVDKE